VVIPFAKLRAEGRPMKYALLKTANVGLNLGLNILFLVGFYRPNFEIAIYLLPIP